MPIEQRWRTLRPTRERRRVFCFLVCVREERCEFALSELVSDHGILETTNYLPPEYTSARSAPLQCHRNVELSIPAANLRLTTTITPICTQV